METYKCINGKEQLSGFCFWIAFAWIILPAFCVELLTLSSRLLFLSRKVFFPHESGALQDVLHLHDVLARVSLARLCHTLSRARALDGK